MKAVSTPRGANLRLALLLGAVALTCYGGIYLFYLLRP